MAKNAIIFDASTLISFAMNGLFEEFKSLKKIFNGKFIITNEVKKEVIDTPLTIKKFELEALKIKNLLDEKIIELPSCLGIDENEISKKTKEILDIANNIFVGNNKEINLIHIGEASCLVLGKMLDEIKIKNVIAIDERTTRMLVEKPENLRELLEKKLHARINLKKENFEFFKNFKIIRSTEMMYVAYKKGLVKLKNGMVLDALLYALKFRGCSISDDEISEIKRMRLC